MHPVLLFLLFLLLNAAVVKAAPRLRSGFYSEKCPKAELIVRKGCDASLLLDDTPNMLGEKLGLSNIDSLRSYKVIDEVKQALEKACPGIVSCADILIMAARDAVVLSGGPNWKVKLGRKDSLTARQEESNNIMPSPRAHSTLLIHLFKRFNLSIKDLVALSGSHSIGKGRCLSIVHRLHGKGRCLSIVHRLHNQSGTGRPDPTMEPKYREKLNKLCPQSGDENMVGDLDATPEKFDNQYFKDLMNGRGFLNSDQTLNVCENCPQVFIV
ncbi:peroxidase superfamily protein [Actinidia rufa]|uniref:Peroxidase superfamily protein n=1 Tax=Actinidia rufa TaxID=165716 RepID=A0A7J0F5T2_9ERIC|nr:peroxidase superfamily protein [Actinidia rufa]